MKKKAWCGKVQRLAVKITTYRYSLWLCATRVGII